MSQNNKRKLEDDSEHQENKRMKINNYSDAVDTLPNEILMNIMKSAGSLTDQVLVVALFAMTSTHTRDIALYFREKYQIPTLAACNIRIDTDAGRFLLSIPNYLLTAEELFLLRCASNSMFYNYLEFREWSLSYTVVGWIYHKYEKFKIKRGKKLNRIDYKLRTEVMASGFDEDDPPIKQVEKTYFWCVLREQELKSRGWTWEAKKWNGFASCSFDDTKKSKELMRKRKKDKLPPLFFPLDVADDELEDEDAEENEDQENDSVQEELEYDEDNASEESDEDENEGSEEGGTH